MAATVALRPVARAVGDVSVVYPERAGSWKPWLTRGIAITDVVVIVFGIAAATALMEDASRDTWIAGAALAAIWVGGLAASRCWDQALLSVDPLRAGRVIKATLAAVGVIALIASPFAPARLSDYWAVVLVVLSALLVMRWAWRRQLEAARRSGDCLTRVLVVGEGDGLRLAVSAVTARRSGLSLAGLCVADALPADLRDLDLLGKPASAVAAALAAGAEAVVVAPGSGLATDELQRLRRDAVDRGLEVVVLTGVEGLSANRLDVVSYADVAGVRLPQAPSQVALAVKRAVDIVGSLTCIVLLSPVLLATALAVKLSGPGPVIFRQERIGQSGVPFTIFKFRSMVPGAAAMLDDVVDGEVGLFYKPVNDPRVTVVGKFIRKTSIDELPQLFNVLNGTMSLVGPRPQIDREVALYDSVARRRLRAKPGMTGLWQVSGRNSLSVDESLACDISYVENWTSREDVRILVATPLAVVRGSGAR